ncbi:cytochrome c family protein [Enhygromyxa salina]|uniref:Cytochrome c family protein n=1 Tax=Enhygromyxa salina TaxID=215803 RepID=A0A0C2CRP5_9BACT|nr:cytochrome c family protein [Enhygromyxa salina]
MFGVVCLGAIGGGVLLDLAGDPQPKAQAKTPPKPTIGSRAPLDAAHTSPEDCASCHPRQTAEWKRSVMGHSAKSPLFQALEILIEEQAGRSDTCPGGAGILRNQDPRTACRDPETNIAITGSGGELWCANCHTPRENLGAVLPAWDGLASSSTTRQPLRDLQPPSTTEGIDCGFCHQVHGPVRIGSERAGFYEGNPSWLSTVTGQVFAMRPEDRAGLAGIANSGYSLDPAELLVDAPGRPDAPLVPGGVHRRPSDEARAYLRSSQFCGACHDVRLFGTDAIAGPSRGEHFRRLRNAYTEWANWADLEQRAGREPADCQDCHMSSFPGVCVSGDAPAPVGGEPDISALRRGCPPGTHFESRAPGELPRLRVAAGSGEPRDVSTHYFSGVDIPLTPEFDDHYIDQPELDAAGIPLGGDQRRDLLLGRSFRFELGDPVLVPGGRKLEVPVLLENTGAGHKIPAGFSQEREFWVHLRVTDAAGQLVYEVGRVDRGDEDLRDKLFVAVNVSDRLVDQEGRPLGMFGADVRDGPDVPQWQALDGGGELDPATQFRGRGLINLQNGFLRCVQCIGFIDRAGRCLPRDASQELHRAARFDDAPFDIDTGECKSNLFGAEALFETYFPVGSLDATRGVVKGPDAIIDLRSAPPGVPMSWIYDLQISGFQAPFQIEARLLFRSFPPFLIKAFADYEARQAAAGLRPSGPLVTPEMLDKLEVVEIATHTRTISAP